jgi:hypothetical protein
MQLAVSLPEQSLHLFRLTPHAPPLCAGAVAV